MSRQPDPFTLIKRPPSPYWYYKLKGWRSYKSTHTALKTVAMGIVQAAIEREKHMPVTTTLGEYLEPFFLWDQCPHIRRLRDEQKSISPNYAHGQRRRLEMYVLPDRIVEVPICDLKRADLLDFRSRLIAQDTGMRTINRTMAAIRIVFREALFREDIDRDPTIGIGAIKYHKQERGVFTKKELKALFAIRPGVFDDIYAYTAFILAAHAGLRRSEVLALTWEQLDLDAGYVHVSRAYTHNMLPKHDKIRNTPITAQCIAALRELRTQSVWVLPDHLVFCLEDGSPLMFGWWRNAFCRTMENAGLDRVSRNLVPHSFRHTLATLLGEANYSPERIRETLGWSSAQIQAGYTHYDQMDHSQQREIIERELR